MFPAPEGKRRIYARPGAITSKLRRAWGLESLKKINGERVSDDRHHAIDAIVLAATTEGLLQHMTDQIKQREHEGSADDIFHVAPPWQGFRAEAERIVYGENGIGGVFVSRAERRRARGKAHDATVKQIRELDGDEKVFERKAIEKLTPNDLDKIPTPSPMGRSPTRRGCATSWSSRFARGSRRESPRTNFPARPRATSSARFGSRQTPRSA